MCTKVESLSQAPWFLGFTLTSLQGDKGWGQCFSILAAQRNHWASFEWTCGWPLLNQLTWNLCRWFLDTRILIKMILSSQGRKPLGQKVWLQMRGRQVHRSPQGLESEAALGIQIVYFLWIYTAIQPQLKLGCWGLGRWAHHRDQWSTERSWHKKQLEFLSSAPFLLSWLMLSFLGGSTTQACLPLNQNEP